MRKWEAVEFQERERVARDLWRMVLTTLGNHAGHDNPFLLAVQADMEDRYPWIKARSEEEQK